MGAEANAVAGSRPANHLSWPADATLMTAGIAGLGAALTDAPALLTAVRWGGAAFLFGYAVLAAHRALRPAALTPLDRPPATLRATLLARPTAWRVVDAAIATIMTILAVSLGLG